MFRKSLIGRRYIMEEEERKTPEQEAPAHRKNLERLLQQLNATPNPKQTLALMCYLLNQSRTADIMADKNR